MLENNLLHHSTESGLVYFGSSTGTACGNECHSNGCSRISVTESDRVVLEGSICTTNTNNSTRIMENVGVTDRGNTSS